MSETPVDADVFDALQDSMGEDFVESLVTTFLEEAPAMLNDLRTAAEADDQDVLRRTAHSLKSNADVFGANALAERARQIELNGIGNDPAAALTELVSLYEKTAAALIEWHDG